MAKDDTKMNLDDEQAGSANKVNKALDANTKSKNKNKKSTKQLTKENKDLAKANKELQKKIDLLGDKMDMLTVRNQRNGMSFSVLRSKILMFNFAMAMTAGKVMNLVDAYGKQQRAEKAMAQALNSTGYAAGQTSASIINLSKSIQEATGVGDELVLQSSALLATFTSISGDVFVDAQKAIIDVAAAMYHGHVTGEALKTTTIQVGKALNDPIKGMTALRRVGIQFNVAQVKAIKAFVNTNQKAKAQTVILKELNKQFGEMGATILDTTEGQINAMNAALSDLAERIGEDLAPLVGFLALKLKSVAENAGSRDIVRWTTSVTASSMAVAILVKFLKAQAEATGLAGKALVKHVVAQKALKVGLLETTKAMLKQIAASKLMVAVGWGAMIIALGTLFNALVKLVPWVGKGNDEILAKASALEEFKASLAGMSHEQLSKLLTDLEDTTGQQDAIDALKDKLIELNTKVEVPKTETRTDWDYSIPGKPQKIEREIVTGTKMEAQGSPEEIAKLEEKLKDLTDAMGDTEQTAKKVEAVNKAIAKIMTDEAAQVQKSIDAWQKKMDIMKSVAGTLDLVFKKTDDNGKIIDEETKRVKMSANASKALTNEAAKLGITLEQLIQTHPELTEQIITTTHAVDNQKDKYKFLGQIQNDISSRIQDEWTANTEAAKKSMDKELSAVQNTSAYKIAQKRGDQKTMDKLEEKARAKYAKAQKKQFEQEKILAMSNIVIGYMTGIAKDAGKFGGMWAAAISAPWSMAAMGAALIKVATQKEPTFAQGGMIGGKPHSQGGTLIEAERGEFVVRKKAVDAIGVEALNKINNAGRYALGGLVMEGIALDEDLETTNVGGLINITFTGNVMSQEFIEEQAIPQIKEAIRRGADIGVG